MTYCAVKYCHNASHNHNNDKKITFHIFPSNPIVAAKWIKKIRLNRNEQCWKPTKYTKICSEHFDEKEKYFTKGGKCKLHLGAVPTKRLHIFCNDGNSNDCIGNCMSQLGESSNAANTNTQKINSNELQAPYEPIDASAAASRKKKGKPNVKEEQFDPFQEYANDSSDDESTAEKQHKSDEEENSDTGDETESSALISEKVFVKSHNEKCKDGPSQAKKSRPETENQLDYTEEMYEFGKFVAEQLLCLSVEEARIVQAEIRHLLTKSKTNKTKRKAEPSTSKALSKRKPNPVTVESSKVSEPVIQTVFAQVNIPGQTDSNVAGSSGPQFDNGTLINQYTVVDMSSGGLIAPIGYIVVPTVTGTGLTNQPGNTLTTSIPGTSGVQPAITQDPDPGPSNVMFDEVPVIKTEPEDPEPLFTHQNVMLPNETEKSLQEEIVIKFEPESGDET